MKKILVLVLLVTIGIVGVGTYNGIKKTEELKKEKTEAVQDALFKKVILQVAILYEEWHQKNRSKYTGFLDDVTNKEKMSELISEIKSQNIDAYYYTHAADTTYVIKIRPANSAQFYCFDVGDLEISSMNIVSENYKSQTNCVGNQI